MLSARLSTVSTAQTFAILSLLTASALATEPMTHQRLHKREGPTYVACYSTGGSLEEANTWPWQSQGYCSDHCDGGVIGLTAGNTCYCGNEIPADSDKVDDSKCDVTCVGWPSVNCGGDGFFSVWTTGKSTDVTTASDSGSGPSSSNSNKNNPTSAPPTLVTSQVAGGSTIVVTVPATSEPTSDAEKSGGGGGDGGGSNTAGIAAGVVVGVVALSGIIAGVWFFLRHKKQKQAEEDFKQRTQVADFMRGSNERKPPGSSYSGMSDARLDPEAGRRNSVGSLADNEDYSRRILRVANPDNS